MFDEDAEILRACRRSRIKFRSYRALATEGAALPGELAELSDTTVVRVYAVMFGRDDEFRTDTSLVQLGVATSRETAGGVVFEITPRGRDAFPRVQARMRRRREG